MDLIKKNCVVFVSQTKRIGYAVFEHEELIHFGVKSLSEHRNSSTAGVAEAIVRDLDNRFSPAVIIINRLSGQQIKSFTQKKVILGLIHAARTRSIQILPRDFRVAKTVLCPRDCISNRTAFSKVAEMFPELLSYLNSRNRSHREYYGSLLTAVALGIASLK